jgi:hypothetical protein
MHLLEALHPGACPAPCVAAAAAAGLSVRLPRPSCCRARHLQLHQQGHQQDLHPVPVPHQLQRRGAVLQRQRRPPRQLGQVGSAAMHSPQHAAPQARPPAVRSVSWARQGCPICQLDSAQLLQSALRWQPVLPALPKRSPLLPCHAAPAALMSSRRWRDTT